MRSFSLDKRHIIENIIIFCQLKIKYTHKLSRFCVIFTKEECKRDALLR